MITSASNPRVKRVIELQTKAKARFVERAFVIEGSKLFLEAPEHLLAEVFVTPVFLEKQVSQSPLPAKLGGFSYEIVSEGVMERMADTKTPQGILCTVARADKAVADLLEEALETPFYLLLEDIRDPGNLGTILRTAEAAGITGAILSQGCADVYNPKTVRATMGSLFRLPFAFTEDLPAAIDNLRERGVTIYGACPDRRSGTKKYDCYDYRGAVAFLLGNESQGLSAESQAGAQIISIPMAGGVESLNAATAAAILLYEAARQRGF
jgi:TrmH family RNA methyltransferase